ncbi:MAG: hypothetical protein ACK4FB_10910 [Brevundimonas sp.]|uniref:hypothetical protein n=1 Tax=Brevundimonas sp. TaxID=1871086 RepID=UPI00391CDE8A
MKPVWSLLQEIRSYRPRFRSESDARLETALIVSGWTCRIHGIDETERGGEELIRRLDIELDSLVGGINEYFGEHISLQYALSPDIDGIASCVCIDDRRHVIIFSEPWLLNILGYFTLRSDDYLFRYLIGVDDQIRNLQNVSNEKSRVNALASWSLADFSLKIYIWIVFSHELCHIMHGHFKYISFLESSEFGEISPIDIQITRKTLEFDADVFAMRYAKSKLARITHPLFLHKNFGGVNVPIGSYRNRLLVFVNLVLFWYNAGKGSQETENHPPSLFRIWPLIHILMEGSDAWNDLSRRPEVHQEAVMDVFVPSLVHYMAVGGSCHPSDAIFMIEQHEKVVPELSKKISERWSLIHSSLQKFAVPGIILPAVRT